MTASKVNPTHYIAIQGWMVTELKLKGNELLIYACIYGFTQEENQVFTGSLQYLADWTNSTKQGVSKNLKSLVEKGFLLKRENFVNGVKFCEYRATGFNGVLNNVTYPMQQSLTGGIKQSLTNNISLNNIENNLEDISSNSKRKSFKQPTLEEIEDYCRERGNKVDAKKFYDYFTAGNWTDAKGNKVKNWKQKLITWEAYSNESTRGNTSNNGPKRDGSEYAMYD